MIHYGCRAADPVLRRVERRLSHVDRLIRTAALLGLRLVDQQPADLGQVHLHQFRQEVRPVLQNQPVTRRKLGNGLGNLRFGQTAVGAAVEQDAVLAAPVHLNDCVVLQHPSFPQICGIDAAAFKGLPEHSAHKNAPIK